MSKLREKFDNELNGYKNGLTSENRAEQCEKIADDFAVKFQNFISSICKPTEWMRIYKFDGLSYTTTELLQIFKDKYYK